jgi:hypothetical protein
MTTDYTALCKKLTHEADAAFEAGYSEHEDCLREAATALRDLQAKLAEAERLGDTLAHCLIHSQDGWALDKWWAMRGHDNCTVCNPATALATGEKP